MIKIFKFLTAFVIMLTFACRSGPIIVQSNTSVSADFAPQEVLGKASGSACGSKIVSMPGAMALDFIPILFSSRLERAMEDAIMSVPGATRLVNVTIDESWFYWLLGMTRCVSISGDAVK